MDDGTPRTSTDGGRRVAALAALPAAAQSAGLLGFAVWEVLQSRSTAPSNADVFQGSVVYLLLSGGLAAVLAVGLWTRQGWAYGAGVFLQVLALAITYEMVRAQFWVGAVPLGLSALAGLALLFSPTARSAFGRGSDAAPRA